MSHIHLHDANTGHSTTREMTTNELAQIEASIAQVAQEQAIIDARQAARQSAIDKLAALGLTVDEISAAFGLEGS
jgi:ribosomal protein S11